MTTDLKKWKLEVLDPKSKSFCGCKWYNASMYFFAGTTSSCHHNPWHAIDKEAIKLNPSALHNTEQKKKERAMMQRGEKPIGCQFCWVMEETSPDSISDRVWGSNLSSDNRLQAAFNGDPNADYDLDYLEIAFDRTCQLGCSYCGPAISSTWAKDIRVNGSYIVITDSKQQYKSSNDETSISFGDDNPYAEAFFKWWDQGLHKSLKILRITGGEPMMSGYTWKLLDWLIENPNKSNCVIHITTNLAYDDDILDRFLDKCSKINQQIEVWTSSETIGAKDEYIRDGLDWDQWERNLNKVIAHPSIVNVGICCTIGVLQADGYAEFLKWFANKKKQTGAKLVHSVNILRFPSFQNVITMPSDLRLMLSKEIADTFNSIDFSKLEFLSTASTQYQVDQISRAIEYIAQVETPHKESFDRKKDADTTFDEVNVEFDKEALAKDFKTFFSEYDRRRGKNLVQTFPRLADWYNSI
jgi:organic radical activating enzyme